MSHENIRTKGPAHSHKLFEFSSKQKHIKIVQTSPSPSFASFSVSLNVKNWTKNCFTWELRAALCEKRMKIIFIFVSLVEKPKVSFYFLFIVFFYYFLSFPFPNPPIVQLVKNLTSSLPLRVFPTRFFAPEKKNFQFSIFHSPRTIRKHFKNPKRNINHQFKFKFCVQIPKVDFTFIFWVFLVKKSVVVRFHEGLRRPSRNFNLLFST